jgi:hypothetical protein
MGTGQLSRPINHLDPARADHTRARLGPLVKNGNRHKSIKGSLLLATHFIQNSAEFNDSAAFVILSTFLQVNMINVIL